MTTNRKNNQSGNYYSGGLAEFVPSPTVLTYSFLKNWFTGKGSIGCAMKILGLLNADTELPVLELIDGDLVINLSNEEKTLYGKTIFKYKKQNYIHETPQLTIDITKIVNPGYLVNTLSMIISQSKWITNPENSIATAEKLLRTIPEEVGEEDISRIDVMLKDKIWPVVIAIGLLSEFYNQLIIKSARKNLQTINKYISNKVALNDWFFKSIADQEEVQKNKLSFSGFIKKYGIRSDKDYELTSPRWHEIQGTIKDRIKNHTTSITNQEESLSVNNKFQQTIDTSIKLQILRSEAKRKALVYIDYLRKKILERTKGRTDISQLTREEIITNQLPKPVKQNKTRAKKKKKNILDLPLAGKGIGISQGNADGIVKNILSNEMNVIKGTIGIFPNASPEFAIQYPKCSGMIFLKGGLTSHGAIVAREFGIPALIDHKAEGITDGKLIELNGATGEWRIKS